MLLLIPGVFPKVYRILIDLNPKVNEKICKLEFGQSVNVLFAEKNIPYMS